MPALERHEIDAGRFCRRLSCQDHDFSESMRLSLESGLLAVCFGISRLKAVTPTAEPCRNRIGAPTKTRRTLLPTYFQLPSAVLEIRIWDSVFASD
jgi:hypothetical protein